MSFLQGANLMAKFGINVPKGIVASTSEEVDSAAKQFLSSKSWSLNKYPKPCVFGSSQGADLMAKFGINVPKGIVASTLEEVDSAAKQLPGTEVVVKSQVLAGGRGLGTFKNGFKGGVHIVKKEEARSIAGKGQHLEVVDINPRRFFLSIILAHKVI